MPIRSIYQCVNSVIVNIFKKEIASCPSYAKHKAVCCDTCNIWYHIDCQSIHPHIYECMNSSNISWECLQCGMPNFSTSFFDNNSFVTPNLYNNLDKLKGASNNDTNVHVQTSKEKVTYVKNPRKKPLVPSNQPKKSKTTRWPCGSCQKNVTWSMEAESTLL